ncbi:claudin-34-like [Scomber scombrus]|uniref:Claudin-34-like n=1 Tax=Scomber scombrus TaxID=13677 RepID=A0AAV1Q0J9_SCOSC|nr:claudin-34-like [Scomber scombrus]
MTYLAHTANAQLAALWMGCVGWTFTAMAIGLVQWRIWKVPDSEVISSGVAWVGLWRVCFNSHTLVTPGFKYMHCKYIGLTDAYTPPEIASGQVLMLLSVLVGLCGNAGGVYALRNVYFGLDKNSPIRLLFIAAGFLCLTAAAMSLIPVLWTLTSVVTNQTIGFPPDFQMPPEPDSQSVGCGIVVGLVGAVLMVVSGVNFCRYRLPQRSHDSIQPSLSHEVQLDGSAAQGALTSSEGRINPAFESHEHV